MVYKDPDHLREYNRQRAQALYADYVERRSQLMCSAFKDHCYLCSKPAGSHFHFHHVEYHATESAYPRNGRSLYLRIKRLAEAEEHPERFRLLCGGCHALVEALKANIDRANVDKQRLEELVLG